MSDKLTKTTKTSMLEAGKCPKCGNDLEYGTGELQDNFYCYDVFCKCGFSGLEEYELKFVSFVTLKK